MSVLGLGLNVVASHQVYKKQLSSIFLIYYSFALFTGIACSPFDAAECNIECSFYLISLRTTLLKPVALD